jgi:hypothetical protein
MRDLFHPGSEIGGSHDLVVGIASCKGSEEQSIFCREKATLERPPADTPGSLRGNILPVSGDKKSPSNTSGLKGCTQLS